MRNPVYPAKWRSQKKIPTRIPVTVNGRAFTTEDVAHDGLVVLWAGCPLKRNEGVRIVLRVAENEISIDAGLIRIDRDRASFAFRHATEQFRHELTDLLGSVGAD